MPILVPTAKLAPCASLALAMSLAAAGAGSAQPAPQAACRCQCDAGSAGLREAIYPATASCGVHEGRTCSFEGPDRTLRTGIVRACLTDQTPGGGAAPLGPHSAGVLMQPDRPKTARPDPPPATTPR